MSEVKTNTSPAECYEKALRQADMYPEHALAYAVTGLLGMVGTMLVLDSEGNHAEQDTPAVKAEIARWRDALGLNA